MNILFIDDDIARHEQVDEKFSTCKDCTVHHAYYADIAYKLLSEQKFDIIFLDHDLGIDTPSGYDIAIQLSKMEKHYDTPVVVHSMNPVGAGNIKSILKDHFQVHIVPFGWRRIKILDHNNIVFD